MTPAPRRAEDRILRNQAKRLPKLMAVLFVLVLAASIGAWLSATDAQRASNLSVKENQRAIAAAFRGESQGACHDVEELRSAIRSTLERSLRNLPRLEKQFGKAAVRSQRREVSQTLALVRAHRCDPVTLSLPNP